MFKAVVAVNRNMALYPSRGNRDALQSGAATCSEGFVTCFLKVPLACLVPLLRYVCHRITEIEGDFIIILYFISLRFLSISMVIAYIRGNTYLSSGSDVRSSRL